MNKKDIINIFVPPTKVLMGEPLLIMGILIYSLPYKGYLQMQLQGNLEADNIEIEYTGAERLHYLKMVIDSQDSIIKSYGELLKEKRGTTCTKAHSVCPDSSCKGEQDKHEQNIQDRRISNYLDSLYVLQSTLLDKISKATKFAINNKRCTYAFIAAVIWIQIHPTIFSMVKSRIIMAVQILLQGGL